MLTVWCLLAELVSQFLLTINPRVYRFLVAGMCGHTFTHSCVSVRTPMSAKTHTHRLWHTYTRKAVAHVDILAFLWVTWAVETCPTVELSMPGQLAWVSGCCNVVNKIPCYLTRPSNRAGSNAFSSSPSFCSSQAGSIEQSCWYWGDGCAQTHMKGVKDHMLI